MPKAPRTPRLRLDAGQVVAQVASVMAIGPAAPAVARAFPPQGNAAPADGE